jgi:Arc/MetJ-type ribon-helix-helix transcriptional regulator
MLGGMVPDTEKVTINLSVVDLGKIDYLVDQGFFSNRTDFIRAAIRSQLQHHKQVVQEAITRKAFAIGVVHYDRKSLQVYLDAGEKLDVRVLGLLVIDDDVPSELAQAVFRSVKVYGVIQAPDAVEKALEDRID